MEASTVFVATLRDGRAKTRDLRVCGYPSRRSRENARPPQGDGGAGLFVQIDRDVGHVGTARLDVNRLRFAARVDRDAGVKAGTFHDRRNVRPADPAGEIPGNAARRLRPGAGHLRAVGLDVAADLEFVAVARAGERLLKCAAALPDRVLGAATNALAA